MTQFQYTPQPGYVPYAQAAEAYRASQAGLPPFGGRNDRARNDRVRSGGKSRATHSPRSGAPGTTPERRSSTHTPTLDPILARAYEALWLRPGAPLSLVKAAYRSLAAQSHPDVGGSADEMLRLNAAYETLRRSLA